MMMIKFINKFTGAEMMVANDRVEEYKAAGHKLAADLGKRPVKAEPIKEQVRETVSVPEPVVTKKSAVRKKK